MQSKIITLQVPAKHAPQRPITITEYTDGHHVVSAPKAVFNDGPLALALQEKYPDHYVLVQDEEELWRVDLYPGQTKPGKSTITLEVPYFLRLQVYNALALQVARIEGVAKSLDTMGDNPADVRQRKQADTLELSAHYMRELVKNLMILPPGVDDELPR